MRSNLFIIAAALSVAAPALASEPSATGTAAAPSAAIAIHSGQTLRDAKMARVGTVDRVLADGSVQIIFGDKFTIIPASTLSVSGDALTTSLTRKEVAKLH